MTEANVLEARKDLQKGFVRKFKNCVEEISASSTRDGSRVHTDLVQSG